MTGNVAVKRNKALRTGKAADEAFLHAEDVDHVFPDGVNALADVSLSIPAGSFTVLVGPSGVGKSTLLRILGGLLQPTRGRVLLKGRPPHQTPEPIGIVFQQENLMPWRTAYENVNLPLEITGEEAPGRVADLLQLVGLQGFEQSYPTQLSGGMAQRVALARALVHEPDLLLMDEPFGALDALTRERMGQELLRIWRAMPVTVFMVTHSISEAVLLADEVLVMTEHPGRITGRVTVDLPRPRELSMQSTPAFHECAGAVRSAIENGNGSVAVEDGNESVAEGAGSASVAVEDGNESVAEGDGNESVAEGDGNESAAEGAGSASVAEGAGSASAAKRDGGTGAAKDGGARAAAGGGSTRAAANNGNAATPLDGSLEAATEDGGTEAAKDGGGSNS